MVLPFAACTNTCNSDKGMFSLIFPRKTSQQWFRDHIKEILITINGPILLVLCNSFQAILIIGWSRPHQAVSMDYSFVSSHRVSNYYGNGQFFPQQDIPADYNMSSIQLIHPQRTWNLLFIFFYIKIDWYVTAHKKIDRK